MRFSIFCLILALFSPSVFGSDSDYLAQLLQQAQKQDISHDLQWRKLLHYEDHWLYGDNSGASEALFLSPIGYNDPEKELEATITAFFSTKEREYPSLNVDLDTGKATESQIPRCQFPARFRYLKKKLAIDESKLPPVVCDQVEKFRARMGAKTAFVVFSSFNLSGPSSAFGHSLLRLSRNPPGSTALDQLELLDFGINWAADVTVNNPVLYAVYGLVGLFRGTYSNIPYYYKVREYNDYESRDLWSYELNLTSEEMEMLVDHIWEMGPIYHRYVYFFRNCSNVILTLIEAAAPRYEITKRLKFFVIPPDTIRALGDVPGLVRRIVYRPSGKSTFDARLKLLTPAQTDSLANFVNSDYDTTTLKKTPSVALVDAALDYMDYKEAKPLAKPESEQSSKRQALLGYRASFHETTPPLHIEVPNERRPDLTHPSSKFSVLSGYEQNVKNFVQINSRFSLHDQLDPPLGMPRFSQIELIGVKMRYLTDQNHLEVEDLNAFRILSINPLERFNQGMSWKFQFGARRFRDQNCDRCFGGEILGGSGYAFQITNDFVAYSLLEAGPAYAPLFARSKVRMGAGPLAGFFFMPGGFQSHFGVGASADYHYLAFAAVDHEFQAKLDVRYNFNQRWSLGVLGEVESQIKEVTGGLAWFF